MSEAQKAAQKQRGRPFEKGRSGNVHGRPRGRLNNRTLMLRALRGESGEHFFDAFGGASGAASAYFAGLKSVSRADAEIAFGLMSALATIMSEASAQEGRRSGQRQDDQ